MKDHKIQFNGITAAGVFLDEVALMPQSFVNQALARCSVKGSKYWFNCNPEGPYHWFKVEWIDKKKEKNIIKNYIGTIQKKYPNNIKNGEKTIKIR